MITGKSILRVSMIMLMVFTMLLSVGAKQNNTNSSDSISSSAVAYADEIDKTAIMTFEISVNEDEWQAMLDNAENEEYISADITINGTTIQNVGIRPKGNSSLTSIARDSTTDRYSFKIKFDEYVDGQTWLGLDKIVLNNNFSDATSMKEFLSYDIMSFIGVDAPLYAYADITLNGESWGFYLAVEVVDSGYLERVKNDEGELYKPDSLDDGGGGKSADSGVSLIYTDDNVSSYASIFDNAETKTDDDDHQRVIEAIKNLNAGTDLEKYVDVDQVLRYLAAHTVVVNLDSYSGNFGHNYYLYENDGQISVIPWDYNMAFGGFKSSTASIAVNFPIDTPVLEVTMENRPLISKLFEVPEYLERYHQYLQQILDGYFADGKFEQKVDELDALISEHIENDPSAFYTLEEYQAAIAELKELGALRAQSIQGQLDGTIPSTTEGQDAEPEKLVDSSSINLLTLGSEGTGNMGGNMGGAPGGRGG